MKKKLFALGMATAIAITGASPVSAAWSQKEKIEPTQKSSFAMWTETYDSLEEVMNNSDICLMEVD